MDNEVSSNTAFADRNLDSIACFISADVSLASGGANSQGQGSPVAFIKAAEPCTHALGASMHVKTYKKDSSSAILLINASKFAQPFKAADAL
jgi:hypothetical protein